MTFSNSKSLFKMGGRYFVPACLVSIFIGCTAPLFADPPATPITPQASDASPKVLLRYKFFPGQVLRYRAVADGTISGKLTSVPRRKVSNMKIHFDAIFTRTVKSVRAADGVATISTNMQPLKVTVDNQPQNVSELTILTTLSTVTPAGKETKLLTTRKSAAGTNLGGDASMADVTKLFAMSSFPDSPLRVGQSWLATGCGMAFSSKWSTTKTVRKSFKGRIRSSQTSSVNEAVESSANATYTVTVRSTSAANGHQIAILDATPNDNVTYAFRYAAANPRNSWSRTQHSPLTGRCIQSFDIDAGVLRSMSFDMVGNMVVKAGRRRSLRRPYPLSAMHVDEHLKLSCLDDGIAKAAKSAPVTESAEKPPASNEILMPQ